MLEMQETYRLHYCAGKRADGLTATNS